MQTTYYRPLVKEDIISVLALDLRQSDREEALAYFGCEAPEAIMNSLANSVDVWVVIHKNNIEAVFGVGLAKGYGIPWFVSTDKFQDFSMTFARKSKEIVQYMVNRYEKLFNYIDSRHVKTIKWLRWLGFTVREDIPYYFHDEDIVFYSFSINKNERIE